MNSVASVSTTFRRTPGNARPERGVASLLVIMVLFFIVSMVAAYASRNLVFEQRTSANQYRSTQALEAADAGLQWALGMLNSGRITANCESSALVSDNTFRQRYLAINGSTGDIVPLTLAAGVSLTPSCIFNGTNWSCSCPVNAAPVLAIPGGSAVFPAFRVRFTTVATRPGVVRVESNGCTRYTESCLTFDGGQGLDNEGRVSITAMVALKGGVTTVPAAPLTVFGTMNLGGSAFTAVNTDPATSITIHAGGAVDPTGLVLTSAPGTPAGASVVDGDTTISSLSANRMFANVFGMWRETYRDQPGAVVLNCAVGGCSADLVRTTIAQSPGRVLWLEGDFNIDSAGDIASSSEPVAIVVTGSASFNAAATLYGVLYVQSPIWTTSGAAQVRGAVVAEGSMAGNSTATVVYDPAILNLVRLRTGSFTLVPGSWRDFR